MEHPIIDLQRVPEAGAIRTSFFGRDVLVTRPNGLPQVYVDVCPNSAQAATRAASRR